MQMNVFSVDRLYELFDELGVPPAARMKIIDSFRRPARDLQPNRAHAPMDMPCPKMGMTIHVANAIERAAANDYLFDYDVLGYLDSPFELNIKYMGRGDKVVRFNWSQGFLVIKSSCIYLDEWFTLDSLNKKCKRNPTRYQREDTGFRCPPLEEAASKLGITYRIRIAEEIDVTTDRNRNFLRSYLVDRESPPSSFIREVEAYFDSVSFTTLEELQEALPKYKLDDFHVALAEGRIAADFSSAFVCDKNRFMVFRDIESREVYRDAYQLERRLSTLELENSPPDFRAGTKFVMCSHVFAVAVRGDIDALLNSEDGGQPIVIPTANLSDFWHNNQITIISIPREHGNTLCLDSPWRHASVSAVQNAVRKLELLALWEGGDRSTAVTEAYTDRSYRTFRAARDSALRAGEDVLAALLPKWPERGNRRARLSEEVEAEIERAFKNDYESLRGPRKWFVYGELSGRLEKIGEKISKVTFLRRIAKETDAETVRKRAGDKAAYQAAQFVWTIRHDTPVHGDYPMQYVHIDHTELDVEVVSKKTGESIGRPILTLIICAFSRRILGFYLSIRKPRYLSCMAALMDMVRRFGRAPEFVVFDGGTEFGAADFKWMLRFLRIGEKPRKTSACREGDVLERIFCMSQKAFIENLFGNTKLRKNPRGLTKKSDPSGLARHTLEELYEGLEKFFFDTYDRRRHGTLLMSPRQKFESGLDRSGKRLGRLRRLKDCIPCAFPTVRGTTRVIDCQRGIRTNHSQYRNSRLERPQYHRMSVQVKSHPIDPNIVYAFVNKEWYPMLRVKTDADTSSTELISLAESEENVILHSRVLESQHEANMATSAIVESMDQKWAERVAANGCDQNDQDTDEETEGGQHSADGAESKSSDGPNEDKPLAEQMQLLKSGGYHAKRYK
ncbi:integrase catalytic domain-containing protein [Paraburkholderia haematera]|nr:DDE-type integrase/transposase/recombinase [Paraburkholderia haematera]